MKVLLELPPLPIRLMIPLKLRGSKPGTETGQKTMVYLIEKLWSSISKFTIIQKNNIQKWGLFTAFTSQNRYISKFMTKQMRMWPRKNIEFRNKVGFSMDWFCLDFPWTSTGSKKTQNSWRFMYFHNGKFHLIDDFPSELNLHLWGISMDFPGCHVWWHCSGWSKKGWLYQLDYPFPKNVYPIDHHLWLVTYPIIICYLYINFLDDQPLGPSGVNRRGPKAPPSNISRQANINWYTIYQAPFEGCFILGEWGYIDPH